MKWLEIIEVRSVGSNRELLELQLQKLTNDVNKETDRQPIKIFNRVAIDTDFSIHMHHDSKEADINGSSLGVQLISILKEYGLINHSVWVEK